MADKKKAETTEKKTVAKKSATTKKSTAAKKPAAKKAAPAAAKKPAAKKPAKKNTVKKIVFPKTFEIQLNGDAVSYDAIVKKINKTVKENIKTLEVYININEQKIYYVVNKDKDNTQSIDLF